MATQGHEEAAPAGDPAASDDTEALVRALFDEAPIELGLLEIDDHGEIVFLHVNAALARLLKAASGRALRGVRLSALTSPEVFEIWRGKCVEAQASRAQVRFEFAHSQLHPGFSLATVTYLGLSAAGRHSFGYTMTDLSARRKLEEQLRSILDSSPGVIATLDRDFNVVTINGSTAGLERIVGTSALLWIMPDYAPLARAAFEHALATGEIQHYELPAPGAHGSLQWYANAVGPLRQGGEIVGLTIISNDITARLKLEVQAREAVERAASAAAELGRKNAELESEIEERRRTEELLRRKQEEIRALSTPLIEVGEGVLAAPLIGVLDEARAGDLMERLLRAITASRIRVSIIDLTGVELVDSVAATHLLQIVRAAGLVGSRCVLSGISPAIAQTMVSLGVGLEKLATFRTLKDALRDALPGA